MATTPTARIIRIVLALGVVLAAPTAAASAADTTITITSKLSTKSLTVAPGTTVTWVNHDGERHRVRSDDGPVKFDSGNLETGESYSFTFSAGGSYPYEDHRDDDNRAYHGTIVVASGATPRPDTGGGDGGGGTGGGGTPPPAGPPSAADVSIGDDIFTPSAITVAVGATVDWTNGDDSEHTVTSADGGFDSGIMNPGAGFAQTFDTAGSFPYFCALHSDMTGTVTVTGGGGDGGGGGETATPTTTQPPTTQPPTTTPPTTTAPTTTAPVPGGSASPETIAIVDFDYDPASRSVPVGTTVRWVNEGEIPHTVTSEAGGFDSGLIVAGAESVRTFAEPGTFDYLCTLHPEMTGTITVTDAVGSVADETEEPAPPRTTSTSVVPARGDPEAASPEAAADTGAPATADVGIVDLAYEPEPVTIAAGGTVTWANTGALPHTVTAEDGSFDSGIVETDGTFARGFDEVGTFAYLCTLHPGMSGTVEVVAAAVPANDGDAVLAAGGAAAESGEGGLGLGVSLVIAATIVGSGAVFAIGMTRFAAAAATQR